MRKGILLIAVILIFPVPGLAGFSAGYKVNQLRDYTTIVKEFRILRSDLERAVHSCTQSAQRDDPDFDAYNEGSSVILFGATPESRSQFHNCMSKKGFPLMKTRK
jgi:hypothetical protein